MQSTELKKLNTKVTVGASYRRGFRAGAKSERELILADLNKAKQEIVQIVSPTPERERVNRYIQRVCEQLIEIIELRGEGINERTS